MNLPMLFRKLLDDICTVGAFPAVFSLSKFFKKIDDIYIAYIYCFLRVLRKYVSKTNIFSQEHATISYESLTG
jgi:hypothetical protein